MMLCRVFLVAFTPLLAISCTSWPRALGGGDADRFAASHYYEPAATTFETTAYLLSQQEVLQAQLDVVTMLGAKECLPASVKRLSLISHRVRRQIEGDLLVDAGHDLVIFQRELRFLRQQLITVSQQTGCAAKNSNDLSHPVQIVTVFFDVDSAKIQETFKSQLAWWTVQAQPGSQWRIVGYTDQDGTESSNQLLSENRVTQVRSVLTELGVSPEQIKIEAMGEKQPALLGEDAFSKGFNRRVDVYVQDQTNNSVRVNVQHWESLGLKQHRPLWYGWE